MNIGMSGYLNKEHRNAAEKLYVVAPESPAADVHRTRLCLEDAIEAAAQHNARWPNITMLIWTVAADGSLRRLDEHN